MEPYSRRTFLRQSALLGGSLLYTRAFADSPAPPMAAPEIDELTIGEIIDTQQDIFLGGVDKPGLAAERFSGAAAAARGQTLESEWGLALHLESRRGSERRR